MPDKQKILIVDDDEDLGVLLQKRFEHEGYDVHVEHNGVDGLSAIQDRLPDLVLLDIMMPEVSGHQIAFVMREEYPELPVVMMTASSRQEDRYKADTWGSVAGFITKPFDPGEIVNVVKKILEEKETKKPNL